MMFDCDNISYQVSEFFEKFQHQFPTIALIEQGGFEETETDTFSRRQVIRIHTSSKQCRVVAVAAEKYGQKCDNYSIPLDLPLKFFVKKGFTWKDITEYSVSFGNDPVYEELGPSLSSAQYESIQSFSFYKRKKNPLPVPEKSDRSPDSSVYKNIPPELPPRNSETKKRSMVQDGTPADELLFSTNTREITTNTQDNALPAEIEHAKIKDVSEALRLLKLDKYIQMFEEEMVDGRMLKSIDGNFLRDEFKFTRVEALRLMNYVKDGHVPK
ncbi:hypothetical protein CHS0354_013690 [Potamilus streckersoni]|uniref:SAM domain-containing protein n=1 Tax=Potamilus streckersoni TaxID=2493646 RepID=A0AAE0RQ90_9BIVA|nr:hypothetical protein CHS0354_013690 [Potamilus streckersoni]